MDCPQDFSVSTQSVSCLPVQCTCFDDLPLEVNGACELPDGCGKKGCIVSSLYIDSLMRLPIDRLSWDINSQFLHDLLSHDLFPSVAWFTQHHRWIIPQIIYICLYYKKNTNTQTKKSTTPKHYAAKTLINCMKVIVGYLLFLKLLILVRSKTFWRKKQHFDGWRYKGKLICHRRICRNAGEGKKSSVWASNSCWTDTSGTHKANWRERD